MKIYKYLNDHPDPYLNNPNQPQELQNLIVIGSHARQEHGDNSTLEAILIEYNAQLNTFWIVEVDKTGQALKDENQNIIKYKLQKFNHPELILDAWTEHSHLALILKKAKEFLISKQVIDSTLVKLKKLQVDHIKAYRTGLFKFARIEYQQHQVENDNLVFLFGNNQFGPKYSLLRIIQISLLIETIELYKSGGLSCFVDITSIRFSIENKLNFLVNFDQFTKLQGKRILSLYNKLNSIYHSAINGSTISIKEIESVIGFWFKRE